MGARSRPGAPHAAARFDRSRTATVRHARLRGRAARSGIESRAPRAIAPRRNSYITTFVDPPRIGQIFHNTIVNDGNCYAPGTRPARTIRILRPRVTCPPIGNFSHRAEKLPRRFARSFERSDTYPQLGLARRVDRAAPWQSSC